MALGWQRLICHTAGGRLTHPACPRPAVQCCVGLHLPPVLSAVVQVAGAAAVVARNRAHCGLPYMTHPDTASSLEAAYRWLEPAIAPLEPLLWLAGVRGGHPQRRCYCGACDGCGHAQER